MHFKLEHTIREFSLPRKELLSFGVKGIRPIRVEVRAPNDEEEKIGHKIENAFCTAYLETNPSLKNEDVFAKIEKNEIMEEAEDWRQKYIDKNGKEIALPSFESFPEHFRSFINQVNSELSTAIKLVINALRWRTNHLGPHQPISTRGGSWSRDGVFWHPTPSSWLVRILDSKSTTIVSAETKNDINELVLKKIQEPVHHELFREAWSQRNGNPRSSIVIAMSSLEVALKSTIGYLVPDSSWIVENLPTPPLVRMLIEYIPKLPVINRDCSEKKRRISPKKIMPSKGTVIFQIVIVLPRIILATD